MGTPCTTWRHQRHKIMLVRLGLLAGLAWFLLGLVATTQAADRFLLPAGDTVFGAMTEYTVQDEAETLVDLAMEKDLGYNEIVDANPALDPWYPRQGKRVLLPTSWILPPTTQCNFAEPARPGIGMASEQACIVVNLAELRLYRIQRYGLGFTVQTYPIGIGREGFATTEAKYRIVQKLKNPAWNVPPSVRAQYPEYPAVIPPGPDNPLGDYALRLSRPDYLIHGTHKPLGIGRRVSRGCVRMHPEDIEKLFSEARIGEEVVILYQPLKVGKRNGVIYVEAHENYLKTGDDFQVAAALLRQQGMAVDEEQARTLSRIIREKSGAPVFLPNSSAAIKPH